MSATKRLRGVVCLWDRGQCENYLEALDAELKACKNPMVRSSLHAQRDIVTARLEAMDRQLYAEQQSEY